jgi:outer membrane protein assembly factor BamB
VDLGEGHAAPVVMNGRVYVLDYDESRRADALRCFSLRDGREIWRRWYRVNVKRNHGMSRTVPAVTDKYVVTIGPRCHVMCVEAVSGALLWGIDLEKDFGAVVPLWYTGQCPLIDGGVAVFAACGKKALLLGVDCKTGAVLWQAPNPDGWEMSHSSVMPMTLNGKKMYVYAAVGGIAGVSAEKGNRGTVLWKTAAWNPSVVVPSPVVFPDGRVFVTAGYGAGSMMLNVSAENGGYRVTSLYKIRPQEGLACEQQTPLLYEGLLFGILPNDAGELRNQFVCFHPDGKLLWASGKDHLYGLGPYMIADGKFFILSDEGVLTAARASAEKFVPLGQAKVLQGRDSWGPIALAGGRMLLRDSRRMVCIDVAAR